MASPTKSQHNADGGAPFSTPRVFVNTSGWGPTALPERYMGVPFTPFGKGNRLGKVADFVNPYNRFNRNRDGTQQDYYRNEEEEESFNLVDTSKTKSRTPSFRARWQQRNRAFQARKREQDQKPVLKGKQAKYLPQNRSRSKQWKNQGARRTYNNRNPILKDSSVKVAASWEVKEQFDLSALTKMTMKPPTGEDLLWCGSLANYKEEYDRVSSKASRKLERAQDVSFVYATTMDDPVIERFAEDKVGNIFATDELMAHLMSCTRSVKPWDMVFTRAGDMLFLDKREDSNLEMLTVNETGSAPPQEESKVLPFNTPEKLSIEATAINQNFQQQVLNKTKIHKYENPSPFHDEDDEGKPAEVAYRYRKFDLGGGNILVARTELHGAVERKGRKQHMSIYALNEWDSKLSGGVEWRQKIDSQRGSVLATELKNNAAKLGRWTAQSLVAGADLLKVGYVSRVNPRDPFRHQVLATQFYKPNEFALQINLNQYNMWGILKAVIELVMKQERGKYVLLKDPNKPVIRLYKVPDNSFEQDGETDLSGSEDEDEQGRM